MVRTAIISLSFLMLAPGALAQTLTYAYDAQGRLVTVTYSSGTTISYVYDAAGNRTQVVKTTTPPGNSWLPLLVGSIL